MGNSIASNFGVGAGGRRGAPAEVGHNSMMVAPKSKQSNESIKVCIRVRPLLPHELMKEEIVYYPEGKDPSLQVSNL